MSAHQQNAEPQQAAPAFLGSVHGHFSSSSSSSSPSQETRWNITMRNSRSSVGRHFQSRCGNILPRSRYRTNDVAKAQAEILRLRYGNLKSPAKEQALETGQSVRACRNQQAGLNCMNLTEFFNACLSNPELQAWGKMMMGVEETHDDFERELSALVNRYQRRP